MGGGGVQECELKSVLIERERERESERETLGRRYGCAAREGEEANVGMCGERDREGEGGWETDPGVREGSDLLWSADLTRERPIAIGQIRTVDRSRLTAAIGSSCPSLSLSLYLFHYILSCSLSPYVCLSH